MSGRRWMGFGLQDKLGVKWRPTLVSCLAVLMVLLFIGGCSTKGQPAKEESSKLEAPSSEQHQEKPVAEHTKSPSSVQEHPPATVEEAPSKEKAASGEEHAAVKKEESAVEKAAVEHKKVEKQPAHQV
ncbi:MAG: hypothetical protein JRJ12_17645, partial [Deltaproteobacteria bacterium]|nr:hypothetical protein [Deltaproteobacteria bacterium]